MNKGKTKGWRAFVLVLGLAALLWPAAAGADELGDLKQELQDQKTRLAKPWSSGWLPAMPRKFPVPGGICPCRFEP